MTKDEFATVEVGDILLAQNGRHMHVTNVDRIEDSFSFFWEAGIMDSTDSAGIASEFYRDFAYERHILKGVRYGTHRTLRHKADFKAKP